MDADGPRSSRRRSCAPARTSRRRRSARWRELLARAEAGPRRASRRCGPPASAATPCRFASGSRTELDAHARGTLQFVAGPLTVIDIGGQDAKIILVDGEGRRVVAQDEPEVRGRHRQLPRGDGAPARRAASATCPRSPPRSTEEVELGSFCTVFTGTEVLGLIRQGKRPADLARAAYRSVVKRVLEMERVAGEGGRDRRRRRAPPDGGRAARAGDRRAGDRARARPGDRRASASPSPRRAAAVEGPSA